MRIPLACPDHGQRDSGVTGEQEPDVLAFIVEGGPCPGVHVDGPELAAGDEQLEAHHAADAEFGGLVPNSGHRSSARTSSTRTICWCQAASMHGPCLSRSCNESTHLGESLVQARGSILLRAVT
jgi:hypothetical protein